MAPDSVLTIREAMAALHLSGPRVHQLLTNGELDGPALPPGRKRHSPNAPRVSSSSVQRYLRAREAEDRSGGTLGSGAPDSRPSGAAARSTALATDSAKAAAQELKVRLDAMREELRFERQRTKGLIDVTVRLAELLRSSQVSADRLDEITDGYSDALTPFLAPDTPP